MHFTSSLSKEEGLALTKGPSPEEGNIQFPKRCVFPSYFKFQTMDKDHKPSDFD